MNKHEAIETVDDEKKLLEYLDSHPWGLDYLIADLEKQNRNESEREPENH